MSVTSDLSFAKFTQYAAGVPEFFIDYIQRQLNTQYDITHLIPGRLESIAVVGEHPFVQATGLALPHGGDIAKVSAEIAGLFPSISIIEQDDDEATTTMGQGLQPYALLNQEVLDDIRTQLPEMKDRIKEGIITDEQISLIESKLRAKTTKSLIVEVHRYFEPTTITIALWATSLKERQILGRLLRSVVYDMRLAMTAVGLFDISIKTSKGLVNPQFGRMLSGQETTVSFVNTFWNVAVLDREPRDMTLPVFGTPDFYAATKPADPRKVKYTEDGTITEVPGES